MTLDSLSGLPDGRRNLTGAANMSEQARPAAAAGTIRVGDLTVNRLGFGAMRVAGAYVWGMPHD